VILPQRNGETTFVSPRPATRYPRPQARKFSPSKTNTHSRGPAIPGCALTKCMPRRKYLWPTTGTSSTTAESSFLDQGDDIDPRALPHQRDNFVRPWDDAVEPAFIFDADTTAENLASLARDLLLTVRAAERDRIKISPSRFNRLGIVRTGFVCTLEGGIERDRHAHQRRRNIGSSAICFLRCRGIKGY
jgi:hypothetical protein